ncbi:39653_t:CDS:1, partial [Gigaspora margarita]
YKNIRIEELREENMMLMNEVEVLKSEIQKKDMRIEELKNENVILTNGIEELKAY